MTRIRVVCVVAMWFLGISSALAWNTPAKHVNALRFLADGSIWFTLFESGQTGDEFICGPQGTRDNQWLRIEACGAATREAPDVLESAVIPQDVLSNRQPIQQCSESVDRMASMLLAAKLAQRKVHVQRDNCVVTEVAMKP